MKNKILSKICKERLNKTAKDGKSYKIYGKDFFIPCEKSPLDTENTIVVGWSSTGKTANFTKPNISNDRNCNYVITIRNDESRNIKSLFPEDFNVKEIYAFNDRKQEYHFNPLLYLQTRSDVEEFAKSIIFTNHRDLYKGVCSKLEITHLTLLILIVRGLHANPLGFSYPNEKYNMLSVVKLASKPFEELEGLVNKVMDRFLEDRLAECWDIYVTKLREVFGDIPAGHAHIGCSSSILLCNFAVPENKDFYSSDDLHLYDLFEFDRRAIVLDVTVHNINDNLIFILSIIRILMKRCRFCQYTKFIFDDFTSFAGEAYNIEDFFRPRSDCSTDVIIQTLEQLHVDCPETWKSVLNTANIIYMGNELLDSDKNIIKSLNIKNNLLKNIKVLSENQEVIILKGYGTFINDKYMKR